MTTRVLGRSCWPASSWDADQLLEEAGMTRRGSAAVLALLLSLALHATASAQSSARLVVRAENTLAFARPDETIALAWSTVQQRLAGVRANIIRVLDSGTGQEVPVQALDANADGAVDSLLF